MADRTNESCGGGGAAGADIVALFRLVFPGEAHGPASREHRTRLASRLRDIASRLERGMPAAAVAPAQSTNPVGQPQDTLPVLVGSFKAGVPEAAPAIGEELNSSQAAADPASGSPHPDTAAQPSEEVVLSKRQRRLAKGEEVQTRVSPLMGL